jgi:hypothetical protein
MYTNREFYDFAHPWNDSLPYTYDSFDFNYCAYEGYDFKTALERGTSTGTSDSSSGSKEKKQQRRRTLI